MHDHYDPMYLKSMQRNFAGFDASMPVQLSDASPARLREAARALAAMDAANPASSETVL
jgi:hypothetical protein